MTQWLRRMRGAFIWTAARETPRGILATIIVIWTVGFVSKLMADVTARVFSENPPDIGAGTAAAYGTLVGSGLIGAWTLFKWAFGAREKPEDTARQERPPQQEGPEWHGSS